MMNVAGLGQLARLIELGYNVGWNSPGSASQHCSQAGGSEVLGVSRAQDSHTEAASNVEKAAIVVKTAHSNPIGVPKTSLTGSRLKLAVR